MLCASIIVGVNATLIVGLSLLENCRAFTETANNIGKIEFSVWIAVVLLVITINNYSSADYKKWIEAYNNPAWNIRAFADSVPITMKHLMFYGGFLIESAISMACTVFASNVLYEILNHCKFY